MPFPPAVPLLPGHGAASLKTGFAERIERSGLRDYGLGERAGRVSSCQDAAPSGTGPRLHAAPGSGSEVSLKDWPFLLSCFRSDVLLPQLCF